MEARARGPLVELHGQLALLEAPEERGSSRRHRAPWCRYSSNGWRCAKSRCRARGCTAPARGFRGRAGPRRRARRRAPGSSARHSRAGRSRAPPAGRFCTRSASPYRDGASRCGGRRVRPPRRPSPAPGAARRAPPDAAARSSRSCCGSGARSWSAPVLAGVTGLLVAWQRVGRAFPGTQEVEAAKFLSKASPARTPPASARSRNATPRSP